MKRGNSQTKSRREGRTGSLTRNRRLMVETLETRQLLASDFTVGPGTLPGLGVVDNVPPRNIGAVTAYQHIEVEQTAGRGLNDSMATAERLPLGTLAGQQHTIDVQGSLPPASSTTLNGTLREDVDFYKFTLRAGDILDIATLGSAGTFDVYLPGGRHWFGTDSNQAVFYPAKSPLMTLGNAVGAQVVPMDGEFVIRVARGPISPAVANTYQLGLRVYRPVLEQMPVGTQQKVFIDFDGELIPGSRLEGGHTGTLRVPSLADSLTLINLTPQEENLFIDKVLAAVEKRFLSVAQLGGNGDFNSTGIPGQFGIEILNSRDHADPGEDPLSTRVMVGGSTADLFPGGLGILGVSTTIDIGNFEPGGLVFVPVEFFEEAVLDIPRASSKSLLDVLSDRLASTLVHELAHSYGIRHTDATNAKASLIDTGGSAQVQLNAVGAGPDGVYGTIDDTPIGFPDFDRFSLEEGFFGNQWVAASMAWSLSTGKSGGAPLSGVVYNDANGNAQRGAGEGGLAGITVFVDRDSDGVLDSGEVSAVTAADGSFTLPVGVGNHLVSVVLPSGYVATTPASRTVTAGTTNLSFGLTRPNAAFTGIKFEDLNGNGVRDTGEPGLAGVYIYVDLNSSGGIDLGEPRAITDVNGNYSLDLSRLVAGQTYHIREVIAAGYEQIAPADGYYSFVYDPLNPPVGLNFANRSSRDFGDAPDSYRTLQTSGGPSHGIIAGVHLGAAVDRDSDGQPSIGADGDDLSGINDEDGIRLLSPIAGGSAATFEITVSNTSGQAGYLQAWFDFNRDGSFSGVGEQVLVDRNLGSGVHLVNIQIPAGVTAGDLYTRWRYSLTAGLGIGGAATSGEVEDHLFTVMHQGSIANDDQFTVSRNQTAVAIPVLANDFETPDNPLRITGRDLVSLGTRGVVTISADGRQAFYTPPLGFIGQDRFTYTVTPAIGAPATATVTVNVAYQNDVPVALDDTFEVAQGSNNIALNVLDNDLPSSFGGMTIVSVTPGSEGGTTSLVGGNQSVRYTPRAGFAGTEEFVYTISDANGNISSATATVNLLPGSFSDDVVAFNIEFLDLVNGQPITDVQAGSEFMVRVTVEDVRSTVNRTGVYSAFLDLLYSDQLVSVLPDPTNPLGFAVQFGGDFDSSSAQSLQSGDATTPGLLDEVGSQRASLNPPANVSGPVELFTVRMRAEAPGIAVFSANPADEPINETGVYGRMTPITVAEQRLGISELVIAPAGGSFTSAIDDAYSDGLDSTGVRISGGRGAQLDVLRNDLLGPTDDLSEFFLVTQPNHGVAVISGGMVVYTPDNGVLNQFDSFTYGIVTADGVRSVAEVTLFVGDPVAAQNTAPVGAKPFDVDISLRVVDGAGNTINRVAPGSRFGVQVYVQDLRASLAANPLGVFAAFTDILYDAGIARPSNQIQGDPFDFDVQFSSDFGVTGAYGVGSRLGIIDEFGSFLQNTSPTNVPPHPALTGQPVLMATLYFDAIGTGEFRMATSPADATPYRDTLLFQPANPVTVSRIRYDVLTVQIGGGGTPEGEARQNALLPADVNGDGMVTPIDALLVLNQLSQRRMEGESGSTPPNHFTDVNGDSLITPLDALRVLNHLSAARSGAVPLSLQQIAESAPGADGIIPVDTYRAVNELRLSRFVPSAEGEGVATTTAAANTAADVAVTATLAPPVDQIFPTVNDEDEDRLLRLLADDVASRWL